MNRTAMRSWIVPPPPESEPAENPLYWCEVCRRRFATLEILMHHACRPPDPDPFDWAPPPV